MSFSEIEKIAFTTEIEQYLEKIKPTGAASKKIKHSYFIEKNHIIIQETYYSSKDNVFTTDVAKFEYSHQSQKWKVYWRRSDDKWYLYNKNELYNDLSTAIYHVDKDINGCFWG